MLDALEITLTDPAAVRALANPEVSRLLHPFMVEETTLARASQDLNVSLPKLHYWSRRFLKFGVPEVTRVQRRTGRAIKHYRATARAFVLPAALLPEDHVARGETQRTHALRAALERRAPQLLNEGGLRLAPDAHGNFNLDSLALGARAWNPLSREQPAALNTWCGSLQLSRAEAKALQRTLLEALYPYLNRESAPRGAKSYLVHLGMAQTE